MIDLGKYSFDILLAYGVSAVLILGLVAASAIASRQARRDLEEYGE